MSDFILRAATPSDAAAIVALLKELADYEKILVHFFLTEELVRRDMFGQACHCDLAFDGDEAVGIATWFWTYKTFRALKSLYLEDLYVKPSHRGRGLGRQMLTRLAQQARAAQGMMEWRVLDWNAPAIAFYQSLGARLVPEWRDCRLEGDALERLAS
jgi:diamine N-acetyltransferase